MNKGPQMDQAMQYDEPWMDLEGDYDNLVVARSALAREHMPTGRRLSPGQTCRDIKRAHPESPNGEYWVDPNEGTANDAIKVYCDFDTEETCVMALDAEYKGQRWTKNTTPGQYFMEELVNGKMFAYNSEAHQLKYLQMLSEKATQTLTYTCLNSSPFGTRLTSSTGEDLDSAVGRHKKSTYIDFTDDCTKDNQWHKATFSIRTNNTDVLPVLDVLLFDVGQENQQFGVELGHVCFS